MPMVLRLEKEVEKEGIALEHLIRQTFRINTLADKRLVERKEIALEHLMPWFESA
jgi:hypothetical protein